MGFVVFGMVVGLCIVVFMVSGVFVVDVLIGGFLWLFIGVVGLVLLGVVIVVVWCCG